MLSGIFFILFRCFQLFFIIPPLGMLAAIVHGYINGNEVTPAFALTLFVVVVVAAFWIVATMILYGVAKHNGYFVAFVDLCFFGALIAGVVVANGLATQSCSNYSLTSSAYKQSGIWVYNFGELCSLVKASYAFAILELILFWFTMLIALWVHHTHRHDDDRRANEPSYRRRTEKHYSRYGSRRDRSRNGSRDRGGDDYSRNGNRSRGGRGTSRTRRSPARSYA